MKNDFAKLSGRRVLVTGGLGFIGSNLAHRLVAEGANVTLVDNMVPTQGGNPFNIDGIRDAVRVVKADVADLAVIRPLVAEAEFLFNLAGQNSHLDSMHDPLSDLHANVVAQVAVLEACRQENPRLPIVFASTRQVYGRPEVLPVTESHPVRPVDVNGIHKIAGEHYHLLYGAVYGLPVSILRLSNTYGPRMRICDSRQTFLGTWVRQLLDGEPLTVFGEGHQLRDFTYVDDCLEALLSAAVNERAVGGIFNLGGTEVVSLAVLAERMTGLGHGGSWKAVPFPPERKVIDIGDFHADFSLAGRVLNWSPVVGLDEGLGRTLEWFKTHGDHYRGERS